MNAVPTALNSPSPAPSTATTASSHKPSGARGKSSSTDNAFDDLMGDAMDSQAKESPETQASSTPEQSSETPVFSPEAADKTANATATPDPTLLLTGTVPSQVVLALAVPATAETPASAASSDTAKNTAGNAIVPEILATDQETTSTPVQTVPPLVTATTAAVLSSATAVAATITESAAPETNPTGLEPEKNTAAAVEVSTKIPMTTTTPAGSSQKSAAQKSINANATSTQPSQSQTDTSAALTVAAKTTEANTTSITSAGTDRAPEQPMQTLSDVWSNTAYRTLVSQADVVSTQTVLSSSVKKETITVSNSEQFAEAVQNALNTPRELLPRRVEIQMQTPPGAVVTLSLTRSNGELRAQFDANSAQTLQWLNNEVGRLQNMNFGMAVRWAPPQMANQQQQEEQRSTENRQENRRREGGRRRQQNSMDALTGIASRTTATTSKKG